MFARYPRLFPLQPLLDAADVTAGQIGRLCKISGSRVAEAVSGGLTVWEADRLACRLGLHPGNVWPEWWTTIDQHEGAAV